MMPDASVETAVANLEALDLYVQNLGTLDQTSKTETLRCKAKSKSGRFDRDNIDEGQGYTAYGKP